MKYWCISIKPDCIKNIVNESSCINDLLIRVITNHYYKSTGVLHCMCSMSFEAFKMLKPIENGWLNFKGHNIQLENLMMV